MLKQVQHDESGGRPKFRFIAAKKACFAMSPASEH